MPQSLLVINADGPETRVALVEDGLLGELYIERKRERGIAGNIYKGRVERVLPGMQAAFVNIGLDKSAYLHVSDVRGTPDDLTRLFASESSRSDEEDEEAADAARAGGGARIEDLLKEGQEIIVQVTKEPISTKGARTTRYISLPGRHLVFMPTVDHIGISRRISSDKERRRLRDIVESMRPPGSGFIVRTVADGVSEKAFMPDFSGNIELYDGSEPIFDGFGIEIEIDRALRRQEEPGRHHHPDQPRGRARGGRAAAHPVHRRHDRRRLHRHGSPLEPGQS